MAARRLAWHVALLTAVVVGLALTPGQAAAGLRLGFYDTAYSSLPPERDPWLERTVAVNADIVRIDIGWPAPRTAQRPEDFDARDPADPQYDFRRADASIVAAAARGLRVLVGFTTAPPWVDGRGRPDRVKPGTWRPSPGALEDYGAALARRYSGAFADPARPGSWLPRAAAFQVWNEPNLSVYLNPQWSARSPASPRIYRRMLNGFYRGVKSVDPHAIVAAAGTAPFGDPQAGGQRIPPARYWRELLCMRQTAAGLRPRTCRDPAHFDVLAHHPYSIGPPGRRALNRDDVSIPDLGKITRVLRAAERFGRALPRARHQLWVTEISFDSHPPDPLGVPSNTHARWLAQTIYLLWRQGVNTIIWYRVGDQPPAPSYAATSQSGVYLRDGRSKPAATAFSFPFVARPTARGLMAWGRSPSAGTLTIQRQRGRTWQTLRRVRLRADGVFRLAIRNFSGPDRLRARVGEETSLIEIVP